MGLFQSPTVRIAPRLDKHKENVRRWISSLDSPPSVLQEIDFFTCYDEDDTLRDDDFFGG